MWNNQLLLGYRVNPHIVLYPNLITGECYHQEETASQIHWDYGTLRGGTPPLLIDGEYLAFFHSGIIMSSASSYEHNLWHYFMGAYTFSSEPPFKITKISPSPIIADAFYTKSNYSKRVIFPGGIVATDSYIYLAYGKDDSEMWIATLDRDELYKSLVTVE